MNSKIKWHRDYMGLRAKAGDVEVLIEPTQYGNFKSTRAYAWRVFRGHPYKGEIIRHGSTFTQKAAKQQVQFFLTEKETTS